MSDNALLKNYYNPKHPSSFGGENRIKASHNNVSASKIRDFLARQSCYTKHKRSRFNFERRPIILPGKNYMYQADLIVLHKLSKDNERNNYILTAIDCFSKYAYAVPIKTKSSANIIKAFKEIFTDKNKPRFISTDFGTEFFNKPVKAYLKTKNIVLFRNFSDKKACIVERFNQTLFQRLSKIFTHQRNNNYTKVLADVMYSYNHSKHRSIQMEPANVTKYNQFDAWLTLYRKHIDSKKVKRRPVFKIGQLVRIYRYKTIFSKGYDRTFTDELFKIIEIKNTHPITYILEDLNNEKIDGIFYKEELVKVLI